VYTAERLRYAKKHLEGQIKGWNRSTENRPKSQTVSHGLYICRLILCQLSEKRNCALFSGWSFGAH